MGAEWYEIFKENIRNEMAPDKSMWNKVKKKYIAICQCGDIAASSNKAGLQDHIAIHTLYKNEGHKMQTFTEADIW